MAQFDSARSPHLQTCTSSVAALHSARRGTNGKNHQWIFVRGSPDELSSPPTATPNPLPDNNPTRAANCPIPGRRAIPEFPSPCPANPATCVPDVPAQGPPQCSPDIRDTDPQSTARCAPPASAPDNPSALRKPTTNHPASVFRNSA